MENFKPKIGRSEFEIDEFEARTINFEALYNADPLRTLKFFKMLGETKYGDYRFLKRKKRIKKKRIYKKMKNIKKFKLFVS